MKHLNVFLLVIISSLFISGCKSGNKGTKDSPKIIAVATYVDNVVLDIIRDSFIKELNDLGYNIDSNWRIITKSANGQASEAVMVAEDLLNMNPTVIVSISTPATKPVFDRNQGVFPHVFSFVSFPETIGISDDSKNTTGLSDGVDFAGTIKLIQTLIPGVAEIGMIYSDEPNALFAKEKIEELCVDNKIEFVGQFVSKEDEVKQACQSLASLNLDVILIGADGVVVPQIISIVDVTNSYQLPLFSMDEGTVELGALAALSVNYSQFGKETARLTHKVIMNGDASAFKNQVYIGDEIVINLKTAAKIGIDIQDTIINKAFKLFK